MDCIYLPKELMTPSYAKYSVETKLLFAMLLTEAHKSSSVVKVAELIQQVGNNEINSLKIELEEINKSSSESERA